MNCSCPDWAGMCKHIAASLYGIGARLDAKPELLFTLRGVDPAELIHQAAAADVAGGASDSNLSSGDLSEIFGIEVESEAPAPSATAQSAAKETRKARKPATPSKSRPPKAKLRKPRSVSKPARKRKA